MKRLTYFLTLGLLLTLLLPAKNFAQTGKPAAKSSASGKKSGFMGDPARKRGIEIGFDYGKKAGKEDKAQGLKPDPKRHEAFQKPEKYHRSEYGSQANFVAGFRGGFLGGYQSAFGKKITVNDPSFMESKPKKNPDTVIKPTLSHTSTDAL